MGFRGFVSELCSGSFSTVARRRTVKAPKEAIEQLEDRVVLYAVSGNAWPNPQVITISFVPDGTNLGGVSSDLNSNFNSNSNLAGWQTEILRAAQTWAAATNINFVLVDDSGAATGSGSYQQGSPTMGDIRIGGYDFGNASLAEAFYPPTVNNFSLGGDIAFNTSKAFSTTGTGFDLYTVAVHEIGHALGLDHSTYSTSEMYPTYTNIKPNLTSDDLAGIRAIYSGNAVRSPDGNDDRPATQNNVIGDATNITSELVRSKKWAIVTDLDITTISDVDYYKVKIPAYASGTLTVRVQSLGLSLLSPQVTLYAENQTTVLGTASGLNQYGTTLTLSTSGLSTGDWVYIKVQGATSSAFGTGAYGLTLDIGAATTPVVPLPNTTKLNGSPLSSQGAPANDSYEPANIADTVAPAAPSISVGVTGLKQISLIGTAEVGSQITIYQDGLAIGTTETDSEGNWSFKLARKLSKGGYQFTATANDAAGNFSSLSAVQIVAVRGRNLI